MRGGLAGLSCLAGLVIFLGRSFENLPAKRILFGCAIGFAAETEQLEQHARGKLAAKGLTAIVANNVGRSDIGFNSDDNEVTVYTAARSLTFDKRGKGQLARDLIDHFAQLLAAR